MLQGREGKKLTKKREKFVKSHRLANNRKFSKRLLSVISVILVISLFSQIIIGAATENESESENNNFVYVIK